VAPPWGQTRSLSLTPASKAEGDSSALRFELHSSFPAQALDDRSRLASDHIGKVDDKGAVVRHPPAHPVFRITDLDTL
jgi:hypothetical protein